MVCNELGLGGEPGRDGPEEVGGVLAAERVERTPIQLSLKCHDLSRIEIFAGWEGRTVELYGMVGLNDAEFRHAIIEFQLDALEQNGVIDNHRPARPPEYAVTQDQFDAFALAFDPAPNREKGFVEFHGLSGRPFREGPAVSHLLPVTSSFDSQRVVAQCNFNGSAILVERLPVGKKGQLPRWVVPARFDPFGYVLRRSGGCCQFGSTSAKREFRGGRPAIRLRFTPPSFNGFMSGEAAEPAEPKMVLDAEFRWISMVVESLKKPKYLAGTVTDCGLLLSQRVHYCLLPLGRVKLKSGKPWRESGASIVYPFLGVRSLAIKNCQQLRRWQRRAQKFLDGGTVAAKEPGAAHDSRDRSSPWGTGRVLC